MRRVAAIALTTLREGSRSRTLPVLWGIFAGTLLIPALLDTGSTAEERFRATLAAGGQSAHLLLVLAAG